MSTSQLSNDISPSRRRKVAKVRPASKSTTTLADLPLLVCLPKVTTSGAATASNVAPGGDEPDDQLLAASSMPTDSDVVLSTGATDVSEEAVQRTLATTTQAARWQRIGWRVSMLIGAVVLIALAYRFINGPGARQADNVADGDRVIEPETFSDSGQWTVKSRPLKPDEIARRDDHSEEAHPADESLPRFSVGGMTHRAGEQPTVVTPEDDATVSAPPVANDSNVDRRPWSTNTPPSQQAEQLIGQGVGFRRESEVGGPASYPQTNPATWREYSGPTDPHTLPLQNEGVSNTREFDTARNNEPNVSWRREQPGVARLRGGIDDVPLR